MALLDIGALKAGDLEVIIEAIRRMAEHNVDFADAYLAVLSIGRGEQVASFDRDFEKLGVESLEFLNRGAAVRL